MYKITQKPNAKGTVAFPSHSTYDVKSQFSIKDYCKTLKKLPKAFQPITICLFWLDYIDPKTEIYRKNGFCVVTAGPKLGNSLDFVKNFYSILSSHKYATSNDIGSYTYYAIDLGIPFFLVGQKTFMVNKNRHDINVPEVYKVNDYYWGKKAENLFSTGPVNTISKVQAQFVAKEMGVEDCLSPKAMNKLLWQYFHKNHYWLKAFPPYIFFYFWAIIIFNGPWIKFLIVTKKRMSK